MAKIITFNLDDQTESATYVFNTKEEWEAHKSALYEQRPRSEPFNEPDQFPCIAIHCGMHDDPNGPYQEHYAFIYKFTAVETTD